MTTQPRQLDFDPDRLRERLRAMLLAEHQRLFDVVQAQAAQQPAAVYLVGGIVRDLLLGRANSDLDFAVEGDAIAFAKAVAAVLSPHPTSPAREEEQNVEVITHEQFGTATVEWWYDPNGRSAEADFATTRREVYPQPAALPVVEFADIETDLARRDFTINALALRLPDFTLLDRWGGLADLTVGRVAILHAGSFLHDPTRIFRAVRYAVRLGFTIKPETLTSLQAAVAEGLIDRLTPDRVRHELEKVFKEQHAARMLIDLADLGVLRAIHPALTQSAAARAALSRVTMQARGDFFYYAALLYDLLVEQRDELMAVSRRLNLSASVAQKLSQLRSLFDQVPLFEQQPGCCAADTRSTTYFALHGYDRDALLAYYILRPEHASVPFFLNELAAVKSVLTGNDLKQMGLPPGPAYTPILNELLRARLDGLVSSREEEEELASELIERIKRGESL